MSFWIPNCEMHMSNVSYRRWLTCLIGFPTTTEKGRSRQSGLVGIQLSWLRASQPFHPPLRKKSETRSLYGCGCMEENPNRGLH